MDTWTDAIRIIQSLREPNQIQNARVSEIGTHETRGENHVVTRYELPLSILDFGGAFIWGHCKKCNQVRYKKFVIFNQAERTVYVREVIRNGQIINHQLS